MEELKPCPFCGGTAVPVKMEYADSNVYYGITCERYDCPCCGIIPTFNYANDAIEAWNKRVNRCQDCLADLMIDDGR